MNEITTRRASISMRMISIISFIVLMLTTVTVIGYVVFSNWYKTVDVTISGISEDISSNLYNKVDSFVTTPIHIIELNSSLIENEVIDVNNETERDKFFVGVLNSYDGDSLYSIGYGNELGEYYGARRNNQNTIEIMRNNRDTGGHSWYYSVNSDMTAGERVVNAGKFDARTRQWYKAAKEEGILVFSPIYKHFVLDDLTVSVAMPIYNNAGELQGVLGTHINLSRIDNYLQQIVQDKNASTVIIDSNTGELVANSLGVSNFTTDQNGVIKRLTVEDLDNEAIQQAYEEFKNTGETKIKNKKDKVHIRIMQYQQEGLHWLALTTVSQSELLAGITQNLKTAIIMAIIGILISITANLLVTNKLLKPVDNLLQATEEFAAGDLTQRADVVREDELGRISKSFNHMAGIISTLVNDLEKKVDERTTELLLINKTLNENKEHLQIILDSTAEAIYGMDLDGNCTFCNNSCIKILGFDHPSELVGKHMHTKIHHSYRDGKLMPEEECKIHRAFLVGKGTHVDDEVFWRKDGTSFDVEYQSYPQYKDGEIIGAVITFRDNTERRKHQEHIKYLSYHDSLTGLYNRMFFEEEIKRMDDEKNLPLSIIFGDVNGLKLTNDIFGHAAGDDLLRKSAEILNNVCRKDDIIARVGGDEFAILLPNTSTSQAKKIVARIKSEFSKEQIVAIKCSISLGYATRTTPDQSLIEIQDTAENVMYKEKMLDRKSISSDMVNTIINTLHSKNPREKHHSINVSEICKLIAQELDMPETEIKKLKEVGYLHDIGKIVLEDYMFNKKDTLTYEEKIEEQQHAVIGYRILNLFDQTLDLAEGVLNHHEHWDGSGYPKGLKGEEIPLMARIIKVAETYDALTNTENNPLTKAQALEEIKNLSGTKLDPAIVKALLKIMTQ